MAEDEIPENSKELPKMSESDYWESLEFRFEEMCVVIQNLRLETEDEAIGKKVGLSIQHRELYWDDPLDLDDPEPDVKVRPYDPESEVRVRPWLQIPWNPAWDHGALLEKRENAKELVPFIEEQIHKRILTVEFLVKWGELCNFASYLEAAWDADRPNLKSLQGGLMQSIQARKVWYAKVFSVLKVANEKKGDTEDRVIAHINKILDENKFPDDRFASDWYETILSQDRTNLTRTFRELSFEAIQKLSLDEKEIIPPVA